jgi:hypothetical protein
VPVTPKEEMSVRCWSIGEFRVKVSVLATESLLLPPLAISETRNTPNITRSMALAVRKRGSNNTGCMPSDPTTVLCARALRFSVRGGGLVVWYGDAEVDAITTITFLTHAKNGGIRDLVERLSLEAQDQHCVNRDSQGLRERAVIGERPVIGER